MATQKPYLTLNDVGLAGKTVLLRVDINSPIVNGKIQGTDRIEAAAETVNYLSGKGARTVLIAHQGRKGSDDYTSLEEHAQVLQKFTKATVRFVPDVYGDKAVAAIKALKNGEVLVLENVRGTDDENKKGKPQELAQTQLCQVLAKNADFFVNDAFSAAHRSQTSMVGFTELIPNVAGLTMDRELTALAQAVDNPRRPAVYILGGAKPEDSIAVMKANFGKGTLDKALLGGIVGNLFLHARGHDLGPQTIEYMQKKGILDLLPQAEALLEEYDADIVTPEDVAVRTTKGQRENLWVEDLPMDAPVLDIGPEAIATYKEIIANAGSLMMNGPMGLYEDANYSLGTKEILHAIAANKNAFSLMGGGHTITAIHQFGLTFEDYGYVSLAGGALMSYLTGEELPAVSALKASATKFRSK
ncbi:MAG TPA: phosphoglycerate kinase [Candidatus Thermoplasmatota archaeon]|nr:phosphoglycerate kinase [Candidatus Thermoplasmatota archaeon]